MQPDDPVFYEVVKRKVYFKEIFHIKNPILMYLKNRIFITFFLFEFPVMDVNFQTVFL